MNKHTSLYAQVLYMLGSGTTLIFAPNFLLGIFGFEPSNDVWIRVFGLLVFVVAGFYYMIAKENYLKLKQFSVYERLVFCSGLVVFVLLGMTKPMLIGFAAFEAFLAIWSHFELKNNR